MSDLMDLDYKLEEIKIHINEKVDEVKNYLLNINTDLKFLEEEILKINKKLKKYEKKYELYIFYEFINNYQFKNQFIDENIGKINNENNLEILKNLLEGKKMMYVNCIEPKGPETGVYNLKHLEYKEPSTKFNNEIINYIFRDNTVNNQLYLTILNFLKIIDKRIEVMENDINKKKMIDDEIKKYTTALYLNHNKKYSWYNLEELYDLYKNNFYY